MWRLQIWQNEYIQLCSLQNQELIEYLAIASALAFVVVIAVKIACFGFLVFYQLGLNSIFLQYSFSFAAEWVSQIFCFHKHRML